MFRMIRHIKVLAPLCLLLLWCCKDKGDKLPKPTQSGANTFGCRIDGKGWVPDGGSYLSGFRPITGVYFTRFDSVLGKEVANFGLSTVARDRFGVTFKLADFKGIGQYYLNTATQGNFDVYPVSFGELSYSGQGTTENYWITGRAHTGFVEITRFDTASPGKRIFSGTFAFTCRSPKDGSVRQVTDGRFDINFATLDK